MADGAQVAAVAAAVDAAGYGGRVLEGVRGDFSVYIFGDEELIGEGLWGSCLEGEKVLIGEGGGEGFFFFFKRRTTQRMGFSFLLLLHVYIILPFCRHCK